MKNKKNKLVALLVVGLIGINMVSAQEKYIDKNGTLVFEASEKLFEEVKAENTSVTAILDTKTGEIAALGLMKGFRFKNSLMEEHFNENYIESETYPKAIFKGNLIDFEFKSLSEIEQKLTTTGILELHGKEKEISTILTIKKIDKSISIQGNFAVTPEDFDIEIPKIVKNKIAREVLVQLTFNLIEK
ncbi:hypothetical protein GGR42_000603 [Saonia flava]|uniref:Lipid/polyisoprenoid-binding YceI-like domain-containing protein n=1 Tax=Saonia flava TaxID=523696 RepID=A0A846QPY0_9FLAO|nr:YceI family protein [Saonia flava]NJB70141.1 hypothetical protein [Saonia flava]